MAPAGAGVLLAASKANATGGSPINNESMGIIPAQTQLTTSLSLNLGLEGKSVSLITMMKLIEFDCVLIMRCIFDSKQGYHRKRE